MPLLPLRKIAECDIRASATEWLESLGAVLAQPHADRARICRETLTALYYPQYADNWETAVEDPALPMRAFSA